MSYKDLQGRRYVNLVRCSTDEQADTSPLDQAKILDEFAAEHGMLRSGDDVVLEGISGSVPGEGTVIDSVMRRKGQRDDFDVLLVQDYSRLTRGGIEHAGKVKFDLAAADIEVVFVATGTTGDMDQDSLIQSVGFYAAQQQAKSLSYAVTRGVMSSMAAGNLPHTFRIPYGVDRLYVGPGGTRRHRLRNLPDGSQQKLEVDRDVVLARYARNPKKGATVHYHRQSDEQVLLIPGEAQQVEVVRRIYRMKLLEGKGAYLTAKALNDEGVPSPTGKQWNTDTVTSILHNPTYTGVGIAERYATGIYYLRGQAAAPKTVRRDLRSTAKRKKSQKTFRPRDEWRWQPHPLLVDYLDQDLRELAAVLHETEFERQAQKAAAPQTKQKPGGDSHGDSPYVLKELLRSKQGNLPMHGTLSGPPKDKRRYYRVRRGANVPQAGSVFASMIPAVQLEAAVLDVVRQVLMDVPNLRQRVERAVQEQSRVKEADRDQMSPLVAERDDIQANLEDALSMGAASRRLIKDKLQQWENRLLALEERIATAEASSAAPALDIDALVATTASRLAAMAESLYSLSPAAVRPLLASLVTRLEVDLQTRAVELDIALPEGVCLRGGGDGPLCVVAGSLYQSLNDTQRLQGLQIAVVTCEGQRGGRATVPCFTCTRRAA